MKEINPHDVTALTTWLTEIPSVYGEEAEIADEVEALLLPVFGRDRVRRIGNSLVAYPAQRPELPTVSLVGHLDTVPPQQDLPPSVRDGKVWGCGASDMKGGLAVMLNLALSGVLEESPYNLSYVFYDREEGSFDNNGLQPLLEGLDWLRELDLAIFLEPTDNTLQIGCIGAIQATAAFIGRRAHSARPWEGENAIHKAGPLLAKLKELRPRNVEVQGLVFREVLTAFLASGGTARNVVPDRFELNLNYRFAPGRSLEEAQEEMARIVGSGCELSFTDLAPAGPMDMSSPILQQFIREADLEPRPKQGWTDVARFGLFGVNAVNFGPGSTAQAHQRNEHIEIAALERGREMLLSFLSGARRD